MRRFGLMITLGCLSLLVACGDMHDQPSVKAQEAPRLSSPAEAVPVSGVERLQFGQQLQNPLAATLESRQRGADLYAINCSHCHGTEASHPGKVGALLKPPPPNLRDGHLKNIDDATLYELFSLGFGRMPPFKQRLTTEERWQLVNYLHSDD